MHYFYHRSIIDIYNYVYLRLFVAKQTNCDGKCTTIKLLALLQFSMQHFVNIILIILISKRTVAMISHVS